MAFRHIVTLKHRDQDGTLSNFDSVVASNAAQTAVVTRVQDGAIMIPYAGFNQGLIQNTSNGTYIVDITDFHLDPKYAYRFWFLVSIDGSAPIETSETIDARDQTRTLRGYSRAIAETGLLGRYGLYTVAADATDLNVLSCNELIDNDDEDVLGSRHEGAYLYAATGLNYGQQRRVVKDGYTPSNGSLVSHRPWPNLMKAGDEIEMWYRVPRVKDPSTGIQGIREAINRALEHCYRIRRITFTATADGVTHYDLSQYPWLTQDDQIGPIYAPTTDANINPSIWPGGAWIRPNAAAPVLEIGQAIASGETFSLDVAQPAHTYIKSGGEWGDSTVGLVDDDDEALIEVVLLVQVALAFAFEILGGTVSTDERTGWIERAEYQKQRAARLNGVFGQRLSGASNVPTWNSQYGKGYTANALRSNIPATNRYPGGTRGRRSWL